MVEPRSVGSYSYDNGMSTHSYRPPAAGDAALSFIFSSFAEEASSGASLFIRAFEGASCRTFALLLSVSFSFVLRACCLLLPPNFVRHAHGLPPVVVRQTASATTTPIGTKAPGRHSMLSAAGVVSFVAWARVAIIAVSCPSAAADVYGIGLE